MAQPTADFDQAIADLRRAAEGEFSGNRYYLIANQVDEVVLLAGRAQGLEARATGHSRPFAEALAIVKRLAEATLSGNQYYLIAHHLDVLAFTAPKAKPVAEGKVAATRPAHQTMDVVANLPPAPVSVGTARSPRSFDDLAAASQARAAAVFEDLGLGAGVVSTTTLPDTSNDRELERRSSESCFRPEFEPASVGEMAPAAVSSEGYPNRASGDPVPNLGLSPAAVGGGESPVSHPPVAPPAQTGETVVQAAGPAHDPAPPPAGETVADPNRDDHVPKKPKTMFELWLDLMFGSKR